MRHSLKIICALFFCLFAVTGCGQKAPLFLPGDPSAVKTDIPAQPAPEQERNEEEDEDDDT